MLGIQTYGDGLRDILFFAIVPMETYPFSLPVAYCSTTLQLGMRTPSILLVNRPQVVRCPLSEMVLMLLSAMPSPSGKYPTVGLSWILLFLQNASIALFKNSRPRSNRNFWHFSPFENLRHWFSTSITQSLILCTICFLFARRYAQIHPIFWSVIVNLCRLPCSDGTGTGPYKSRWTFSSFYVTGDIGSLDGLRVIFPKVQL